MAISTRQNQVLKVVHPGRHVEIFAQPITAGQLMTKYPRHCIARPDVFQFPWIVVRPESLLVPGKVFYLMPYRTLDKLLKNKRHELESLDHSSPTKSMAGVTPRYPPSNGVFSRRKLDENEEYYYDAAKQHKDADADDVLLNRLEFYDSWNKMRRVLDQSQDQSYPELDLPFNGNRRPSLIMRSRIRERVMNAEERFESVAVRPRSCLSRPDSDRKKLSLNVRFASPIAMSGGQRVSSSGATLVQD